MFNDFNFSSNNNVTFGQVCITSIFKSLHSDTIAKTPLLPICECSSAASSVAIGLAIEGEGKINYSLDMEENPMINNSDSEESSISEDTSDSDSGSDSDIGDMEARNISRKKRKYKAKDEIFNNALRSSSESSSDSNSSDDDVYQEADKDRKLVLKQMSKNRRDGNNWQKKNTSAHFAAWMNDDDEVEFRVPRSRLHQV